MKSLCPFILLAAILALVIGHNNIHVVNVTCKFDLDNHAVCTIRGVDHRTRNPSNLNILNAEASENITYFNMTEGHYAVMPLNLFQLFPKVVKLEISTGLEVIAKENFIGGNKLRVLILRENNITEIKAHTFDGTDKLTLIDLAKNKMTKIESNAFAGAINLNWLDLSNNQIDTIEDGALNIPTLEEIDLSHNKLQSLADNAFVGCPDLKTVALYGNELTRIGKSIENVPLLTTLMFDNNDVQITDFDFYAIARKPHLREFSPRSVGLVLDDSSSDVNENYTVKHLDISGNDLLYPDILHRLRNFRNLESLDISNNDFTSINDVEHILQMFPKLKELNVDQLPCKDVVNQRLKSYLGYRANF